MIGLLCSIPILIFKTNIFIILAMILIFIAISIIYKYNEYKYIKFLGKMLPYSMISLLVIYCLKDINIIKFPYALPELISIAIIIILHIIKRNVLISIGAGTIIYMFLVQVVFV